MAFALLEKTIYALYYHRQEEGGPSIPVPHSWNFYPELRHSARLSSFFEKGQKKTAKHTFYTKK